MNAVALEPGFALRPMRDQDVEAVLVCERAAYEFPWSGEIFSDCLRVGYNCWVVEIGRLVVGHGILSIGAGECHVLNLCVHPRWQGLGLGRRLLRRLLALARTKGADTAFLEVRISNRLARALYASEGFCEIGERKGYYPARNGREDAVVLARAL
ncbi:MAG: ribosomal protein S18-alanine N-acetyltransferase [Bdellovibrio bacteriovorus]